MVRARVKGYGDAAHCRTVRVNPLPRFAPPRIHTEPPRRGRHRAFGPLPRPPITAVIGPPEERLATEQHLPRAATTRRDTTMPTTQHHDHPEYRSVRIPGSSDHAGHHLITITLRWVCPVCGG